MRVCACVWQTLLVLAPGAHCPQWSLRPTTALPSSGSPKLRSARRHCLRMHLRVLRHEYALSVCLCRAALTAGSRCLALAFGIDLGVLQTFSGHSVGTAVFSGVIFVLYKLQRYLGQLFMSSLPRLAGRFRRTPSSLWTCCSCLRCFQAMDFCRPWFRCLDRYVASRTGFYFGSLIAVTDFHMEFLY